MSVRKILSLTLVFTFLLMFDWGFLENKESGSEGVTEISFDGAEHRPFDVSLLDNFHSKLDSRLNLMLASRLSSSVVRQFPFTADADKEGFPISVRVTEGPYKLGLLVHLWGGRVGSMGNDYLEAVVPIELLVPLANRSEVAKIVALTPATSFDEAKTPGVTNNAVSMIRSDIWNDRGYSGRAVKIGVIDGGFKEFSDHIGTELPRSVYSRCYSSIVDWVENDISACETDSDHGTSVSELVMDVAPEATLYIANPQSPATLRDTVEWMVSEGVVVINHSIGWLWDGPGDGTSLRSDSPLNTVDYAVQNGITWINGVGNERKSSWFGTFTDYDEDSILNFDVDTNSNYVHLVKGEPFTLQLRWHDSWEKPSTDLNLYLYPYGSTIEQTVAKSIGLQSGVQGQLPTEILSYIPEQSGRYSFAVVGISGPVPAWLQLQAYTSQVFAIYTSGYSISNPSESKNAGMLAVGAAGVSDPLLINPNSSRGPTPDGRTKPDIVGPDGVDTASRSAWRGTSQAAPHVAGLAVLVKERFPNFTPGQVASYLKSSAEPRDEVPDNTWGYGFARLPFLTPAAPVSFEAAIVDAGISFSWSEPLADGGMPITGYLVSGAPNIVAATTDASRLDVVFQELTEGINYEFEVLAVNGVGNSEAVTLKVVILGNEVKVNTGSVALSEIPHVLGLGLPSVGDQALSGASRLVLVLVLVLGSSFIIASTLMLVFDKRRQS
jgi:phosphotransferase system IIB component